jgi:hypothetical protein
VGWGIDLPGIPAWVPSPGPRPGWYLKNFYDSQPALNFGWVRTDPEQPWRDGVDAPGPQRNRAALREIIDFLAESRGGRLPGRYGFLAGQGRSAWSTASAPRSRSGGRSGNGSMSAYPEAVLLPEGEEPRTGAPFAFDADFALVIFGAHASLFDNHAAGRLPWQTPRRAVLRPPGRARPTTFLQAWARLRIPTIPRGRSSGKRRSRLQPIALWRKDARATRGRVHLPVHVGEHPEPLLRRRDRHALPARNAECRGAVCNPGYNRAGCRTPMQWDDGPNAGFSSAPADALYLPSIPATDRPTVAAQDGVAGSTLTLVRELLALRRATPALQGHAPTRVVHPGYPFAYARGETHLVVVNPRREPTLLSAPEAQAAQFLWGAGAEVRDGAIALDGFGYGIFAI